MLNIPYAASSLLGRKEKDGRDKEIEKRGRREGGMERSSRKKREESREAIREEIE